jgi:hypothetical protein
MFSCLYLPLHLPYQTHLRVPSMHFHITVNGTSYLKIIYSLMAIGKVFNNKALAGRKFSNKRPLQYMLAKFYTHHITYLSWQCAGLDFSHPATRNLMYLKTCYIIQMTSLIYSLTCHSTQYFAVSKYMSTAVTTVSLNRWQHHR